MAAHRYWRLCIFSSHGGLPNMKSVELRVTSGGSNLALSGSGVASASSFSGSQYASLAFDGNDYGTWWTPNAVPTPSSAEWVQWDFGSGNDKDIGNLRIRNSGYTTNNANSIGLYYSDDGANFTPTILVSNPSTIDTWYSYNPNVVPEVGVAVLSAPTPLIYAYGAGFAALKPSLSTLYGFGGATARLVSPLQYVFGASGANVSLFAPVQRILAYGSSSLSSGASISAPMQALLGLSGASASLAAPKPALAATGTAWVKGGAAIGAPAPTLTATGTVSAVASSALLAPMAKVIGYFGAVASIEIAGKIVVAASGTAGATGGATIKAPLYELTASGAAQNYGTAILAAPSARMAASGAAWILAPGAQLTAIGTAVIAVNYEAYALNLKHQDAESPDELTHYTNYPFDKIVRYQNSYFGVNATGLYLLEGPTDFAEPTPQKVVWSFKTCMTDFETPNLKTVNWAYFGGRMAPAATISIHYGDTGEQNYAYTTPRGASAQNYRQPFGRGIKSRYYAFEAEGAGVLSLDSLMFDIAKSARKV